MMTLGRRRRSVKARGVNIEAVGAAEGGAVVAAIEVEAVDIIMITTQVGRTIQRLTRYPSLSSSKVKE